ncbi:MAG TPA: hypothetical protein VFK41_11240 [Nocardioidaceae bacterium]|nr:hypothetical protein [Nocardioidaceae bacterium]
MLLIITLGVLSGWFVLAVAAGLGIARAIKLGQRAPRPLARPAASAPTRALAA